jgi:hypothetical protein
MYSTVASSHGEVSAWGLLLFSSTQVSLSSLLHGLYRRGHGGLRERSGIIVTVNS